MASQTGGKTEKKRISFLMPYIDFCFMLIIIFVSMLAIAYFEPLGTTDIQAERDTKIDIREGENPVLPTGIQPRRSGVGEETGAGVVRLLVAPNTGQPRAAGPKPAAARPASTSSADADKLKKELAEKEKRLKELEEELKKKKDKVGKGDHLYIDLGGE